MRKVLMMTLVAIFAMASLAFAANDATTAAPKIGVVDMRALATQSDQATAAKAQMEQKYGKERKDLEAQGEKLRKRAEGLKSPKATEESKLDFLRSKQELDQKTRNFMRKVEQDEVKLRQDMVASVFNATYEVARRSGYTFVVDVAGGGVLYADQSMDLTKEVLAEMNKMFKNKPAEKPAKDKEKK